MIRTLSIYFILITLYSVSGWIIESVKSIPREKKFINRGFLIGPYCPVYGAGALLISLIFQNINNIFITFFGSLLICGLVEYLTSYIMERLFKTRWWDYSHKKININGRICLEYLIYFGIAGVLIIYIINPILLKYINMISTLWLYIISFLLSINYIVDLKWSLEVASGFKKINNNIKLDSTDEISEEIKKMILKKFKRYTRLANAFPKTKENIMFDKWKSLKK